jgi:hypothetical protein
MKKVPTREQYQQMVRAMSFRELEGLAEIFKIATALTPTEVVIRHVIDAEIERRIARWEVAYV